MTLQRGTSFSHYRIDSLIGAGGMGEVYRAQDSQLDRPVAIKVLPPDLVRDSDRVRRFVQEAKTASSLNHPHIVVIYEIGRHDDVEFIAMELIEGRTLRNAIYDEKLALKKLTELLAQVADALAKAHSSGIVHRDLKPDNIMVTRDGFAKVLDFGLAKLTEAAVESPPPSHVPTHALSDRTREGIVLGTPSYMSPEQAQGKSVDHRTDIFSLGCILYEAATRKKAFESGSDLSALEKIVHQDPPAPSVVNPKVPPQLSRVIHRCLAKDPDERYQSMKDVAIELREISQEFETLSGESRPLEKRSMSAQRLVWLLVVAAIATATWMLLPKHQPQPIIQSTLSLPAGWTVSPGQFTLSPDGTKVAFALERADYERVLWVRRLDNGTAEMLHGSDGGIDPFWSSDGRFVGYFGQNEKLETIPASGGVPEFICDLLISRGITWNREGVFLLADQIGGPIKRVRSKGERPVAVTHVDVASGERTHVWPSFLPDGKHFLYSVRVREAQELQDYIYVGSLDGNLKKRLTRSTSNAMYAEPGMLIFMRGHKLLAHRFHAKGLQLEGEPSVLADHVSHSNAAFGPAKGSFSVSQNGFLVYQEEQGAPSKLVMLNREGKQIEEVLPPGDYQDPVLFHDGRKAAVSIAGDDDMPHINLIDFSRRAVTRLMPDPMPELAPTLSRDDRRILFASYENQPPSMVSKNMSGIASQGVVPISQRGGAHPNDVSPDGRFLLYQLWWPIQRWDLFALSLADGKSSLVAMNAEKGKFSPDGRSLAYTSNDAKPEIFVQSFPSGADKVQVSTNGGDMPLWRSDGKELFYYAPDHKLMSVNVTESRDGSLEVSAPSPVFDVLLRWGIGGGYAVSPDGQRFLANIAIEKRDTPITLVQNWPALLNK